MNGSSTVFLTAAACCCGWNVLFVTRFASAVLTLTSGQRSREDPRRRLVTPRHTAAAAETRMNVLSFRSSDLLSLYTSVTVYALNHHV